MPEIEIRPAISTDIPLLAEMDHYYSTDHVWQMEINSEEEASLTVSFREVRLPRPVRVEYPRHAATIKEDWTSRDALLVAILDSVPVGYLSISLSISPRTAWITDLVIAKRWRRQGIASGLLIGAQQWAKAQYIRRVVMEMQPKNYPAIQLANKMGFEFSGYSDWHFANLDIAIFFTRNIR